MATYINIEGLDRRLLLKNLFDAADTSWGYISEKNIDELLSKDNGYIEYMDGVPLKTDFSKITVNTFFYNEYAKKWTYFHQENLFESVVADMRKS